MNRKATILASACVLLAVFAASMAGIHASRNPAGAAATSAHPSTMPHPVPAPIFLKSKLTAMDPKANANAASGASTSAPASGAGATDSSARSNSSDQDQNAAPPVLRFASNPEPIPLFLAQDIFGNMISTASYRGKVVFVNFWATWCEPCREEIPDLIKLQENYKDQFQVISISEDDAPPAVVRKFATEAQINYPIILLNREIDHDFGGVPALPTSFVINKDGGIVQKHVGLFAPELFEAEIRTLADLPGGLKVETFVDQGQIFLSNAANATDLPGVDFTGLTADEKSAALHEMNAKGCTCGCKLTLAQCRINDTACEISKGLCAKIVESISKKKPADSPNSGSTD
jgi:thiol-disulfide isomerase/thioredoxin